MFKIINYELKANKKLTIAHLSDIHFASQFNSRKFRIILKKIAKLKPDYICITGDIIDDVKVTKLKKLEDLISFIDNLSIISKVIVSLGNHDIRGNTKWYLRLKNVILLDNNLYEDDYFCFYGITMPNSYYKNEEKNELILLKKIKEIKLKKKYNILLIHSPINFDSKIIEENNRFDLVLAGHTHNGITPHFILGNRGIIGPNKKFFPKNVRNSFKSGNSIVIVSGGITKLPLKTGILHLFNPLFSSDLNYIYLKK